jgi:hypothetical protein
MAWVGMGWDGGMTWNELEGMGISRIIDEPALLCFFLWELMNGHFALLLFSFFLLFACWFCAMYCCGMYGRRKGGRGGLYMAVYILLRYSSISSL